MTDKERVALMAEDNPVGPMRLRTSVNFGQRAAALSGIAHEPSEGGLFDRAAPLSWPWPDHPTCSLTKAL